MNPCIYLDPKNDLLFKRVFGEHEDLLRSFLNALLPLPADAPIISLEYLMPEQVPEVPGLFKNSIVDVKCVDKAGRTFIVEMQMLWIPSFQQRMVFNGSQAFVKQLKRGRPYTDLKPVYALALINDVFDTDTDEFYHHYEVVNLQAATGSTHKKLQGLEFVFVELPKFKAKSQTDKRMLVLWLQFLSQVNESTQTIPAELSSDPDIGAALDLVKVAALSEAEIAAYHESADKLRVQLSVVADMAASAQQHATERALAIAKNLLAAGMPAKDVAMATQLPLRDVQALVGL